MTEETKKSPYKKVKISKEELLKRMRNRADNGRKIKIDENEYMTVPRRSRARPIGRK